MCKVEIQTFLRAPIAMELWIWIHAEIRIFTEIAYYVFSYMT